MSRRGGSSTLSGVDYQVLYTANRFAEAITGDNIIVMRPEAHLLELSVILNTQQEPLSLEAPPIDDLTITHRQGPNEYISLKKQAGQAAWNISQLISRDILDSFFQQSQLDPNARLLLVTQSPIEPALQECIARADQAILDILPSLGSAAEQVYQKVAAHLRQYYPDAPTTDNDILRFLSRIEFHIASLDLLMENTLLRLQPHTQDAKAASSVLYKYAMHAGKHQQRITPETIRQELIRQGQPLIVPPLIADILVQFEAVSSTLDAVPATIGQQSKYHIERDEVAKLVE